MALQIMKNIAEAEQKSDIIKASALQEVEKLKSDTELKYKAILNEAEVEAKKLISKSVEEAVEAAQNDINDILAKSDDECSKINEIAKTNMTRAVEAVFRKVVGIDGNS